jgi:protein-S-isoprenylcysteine O-methyltransferase Ste14
VRATLAEPRWTAAWVATGLIIAQIVLLVVLGGGQIGWLRALGWALWILAAIFGWWPIYEFKSRGGVARGDSYVMTTRLVDSGPYAIVRHPQFVAWPLMSVAVALISQQPVVIAMGAAALVLSSLDFRREDTRNLEKFGEEYRKYMERVPGWNFVAGVWRWAVRRLSTRP